MTSLFDQLSFSARLFHPSDHDTLAPQGARDVMLDCDSTTAIHVRLHEHPTALATILLFHGNGEVVADYDGFAQWYREAGANLAIAEFRGYGRCDGTPSLRSCLADARLVLRRLSAELHAQGRPVIVMGRSLGSFCALEVASRDEGLLDALVLDSAIGDLDGFVTRRGFDPSSTVTETDRQDFCPLRKAAKVRLPTLLLHGDEDDLVHPDNARALHDACAGAEKRIVMVPERGHNDLFLGKPYWPALASFIRDTAASPRMPPRALIFDLDGLLVDSEPVWFDVEGGFLRELGHPWTREDAERCMGQGTPNTLRIWRERFGVDVDIPRDTERIVDRVIARAADMPLKRGAAHLLETARRYDVPMAVASSSPRRLIESVLEAKGIRGVFAAVASGQEVARSKPAPDVFLRAAELLGVPAAECVVLEDALAGVQGGVASGARVVAVPSIADPRFDALATWVVGDLDEATRLLFPA